MMQQSRRDATINPNPGRVVHILLVEDDPADQLVFREALRETPVAVEVDVVKDGVEALAYLRGEGECASAMIPDLVVMDLKMPRMGGLEALAAMKADEQLRRVPVVVLSTSDAPQDILRAYDLQASCYLTKPADLAEFRHVMGAFKDFCLAVVKLPPRD